MIKNRNFQYTNTRPLAQALLALGLFVVAAIAAQQPSILVAEAPLFYAVYGLPTWLYIPFLIVTQLGSVYILGALTILFAIKRRYHRMIRVVMTGTLAYTLAGVAKDLWGRARPEELFSDVVALEAFVRGAGFPSGHVALATALGLTVGHYLPKKYHWVIVAWVSGVALSRMYLGVHTPLDLVGGFAVGWLSYALLRQVRLSEDVSPKPRRSRRTVPRVRKSPVKAYVRNG